MARLTVHAQAIIAKQQMVWKSSGMQVDCIIIQSVLCRSHLKISVAVRKWRQQRGFYCMKRQSTLLSYMFCKGVCKTKVETGG